jgi:hypothetical protein
LSGVPTHLKRHLNHHQRQFTQTIRAFKESRKKRKVWRRARLTEHIPVRRTRPVSELTHNRHERMERPMSGLDEVREPVRLGDELSNIE